MDAMADFDGFATEQFSGGIFHVVPVSVLMGEAREALSGLCAAAGLMGSIFHSKNPNGTGLMSGLVFGQR